LIAEKQNKRAFQAVFPGELSKRAHRKTGAERLAGHLLAVYRTGLFAVQEKRKRAFYRAAIAYLVGFHDGDTRRAFRQLPADKNFFLRETPEADI
jgi:hypothetical protein